MTQYLSAIGAHLGSVNINLSTAMIGGLKAGAALGLALSIPKVLQRMMHPARIEIYKSDYRVLIGTRAVTTDYPSEQGAKGYAAKLNSIPRLIGSILSSMVKNGVFVALAAHAISTQYPNSPLNPIIFKIAKIGY